MSKRKRQTSNAVEILKRRYVGKDPERIAQLQEERVNAEVARRIHELRQEAGPAQRQLAQPVGTTQSVISCPEDADHTGHSLSMVKRIAKALNKRVSLVVTAEREGS
jgi:ribosome-binding protein aMBF1 (putative translation factor)